MGLGIGSTAYSMAQDPRVGQRRLRRDLRRREAPHRARWPSADRAPAAACSPTRGSTSITGDGRRWLLVAAGALRPDRRRRGPAQHGLRRQPLLGGVLRAGREPPRPRRPVRPVDPHRARAQQRPAGVPPTSRSARCPTTSRPASSSPATSPCASTAPRCGSGSPGVDLEASFDAGADAAVGRVLRRRRSSSASWQRRKVAALPDDALQPRPPPARRVLPQRAPVGDRGGHLAGSVLE